MNRSICICLNCPFERVDGLIEKLTDLHSSLVRLDQNGSLNIAYLDPNTKNISYLTHCPETLKFAKKLSSLSQGWLYDSSDVNLKESFTEGLVKMLAVWKRRNPSLNAHICFLGASLLEDESFSGAHVHGFDGLESIDTLLVTIYDLDRLTVNALLVGYIQFKHHARGKDLRLIELPAKPHDNSPFDLIICNQKLPLALYTTSIFKEMSRWMDEEDGHVYECKDGFLYQLCAPDLVGNEDHLAYLIPQVCELLFSAHLNNASVLMFPFKYQPHMDLVNVACKYEPCLFNCKYPLLLQLSSIFTTIAHNPTSSSSEAETQMLTRLLKVVINEHQRNLSGDLFPEAPEDMVPQLHARLEMEMRVLGRLLSKQGIDELILKAYDENATLKRTKLTENATGPGCIPYLTTSGKQENYFTFLESGDPLLLAYYGQYKPSSH